MTRGHLQSDLPRWFASIPAVSRTLPVLNCKTPIVCYHSKSVCFSVEKHALALTLRKPFAPSYREDKGQIRIITGNAIAVAALHAGTKPLPDGSVLAKVAWKAEKHPSFPVATVPGAFAQVEFMVKDAKKYQATGGWGFARFVGNELKPYGKDPSFVGECFGCHTPVANNDYLFTKIVQTP